jgi:hypothetical protein
MIIDDAYRCAEIIRNISQVMIRYDIVGDLQKC